MSSPAAPMETSETDGFKINRKIQEIVKQNFKMLLLTMPGERIMDPAFGCGLKYALFEQFGPRTNSKITQRIWSLIGYRIFLPMYHIFSFSLACIIGFHPFFRKKIPIALCLSLLSLLCTTDAAGTGTCPALRSLAAFL